MPFPVELVLFAFLILTAISVARVRDLFAAAMLGPSEPGILEALESYRRERTAVTADRSAHSIANKSFFHA